MQVSDPRQWGLACHLPTRLVDPCSLVLSLLMPERGWRVDNIQIDSNSSTKCWHKQSATF